MYFFFFYSLVTYNRHLSTVSPVPVIQTRMYGHTDVPTYLSLFFISRPFNCFQTRMLIGLQGNSAGSPISCHVTELGFHLMNPSLESVRSALALGWMAQ